MGSEETVSHRAPSHGFAQGCDTDPHVIQGDRMGFCRVKADPVGLGWRGIRFMNR